VETSRTLFAGRSAGSPSASLDDVPERRVSRAQLRDLSVVDLLVASGLASSKADARRGIQGKGFYLNDVPIETADLQLAENELQGPPGGRFVMLRKGKKNYVRLVLEP
jgi:tyrosyl-tRNA synthetase